MHLKHLVRCLPQSKHWIDVRARHHGRVRAVLGFPCFHMCAHCSEWVVWHGALGVLHLTISHSLKLALPTSARKDVKEEQNKGENTHTAVPCTENTSVP